MFQESSRINSTWGANFVDIVRSKKYIEIITQDNLVENAAIQGEYFLSKLKNLVGNFPELVSNVRGRGLFLAFELSSREIRDKIINETFSRKMVILKSGIKSIRFRPSLLISESEIDE